MEIKLKENERIDDLEIKNMKIIQNTEGFCFGIDSVLLSDFAKEIKKDSRCIDLGTGTGILGILLCAKTNLAEIIGVEIQKEVSDMAERSIKLNNLEDKFKILNMDIKELVKEEQKKNIFDYVITNPPYKKLNTGKINENEKKLISRHELKANLEDFIKIANFLLKDKGTIFMVHKPERLVDIIELMRREKIEPKEIRFVYPKEHAEANLFLIKAIKNGGSFLKIDKPLYVYNEEGNYTDEILKIYQKEKRNIKNG